MTGVPTTGPLGGAVTPTYAASLPSDAALILRRYRTCEFTTFMKDGTPNTWPLCARWLDDGRFLLTTSIGFPQKAFNIRRNPRVSLSFSDPTGSGVTHPGAVLVQGRAVCDDRIVTDPSTIPELEAYFRETIFARQPAGKLMSSWLGRRLMDQYYMRLLIYVTPERVVYWPTRDFTAEPQELHV